MSEKRSNEYAQVGYGDLFVHLWSGILRRYTPFLQYVRTYVVLLLYADGGGMLELEWGERIGEQAMPWTRFRGVISPPLTSPPIYTLPKIREAEGANP